MPGMSRADLHRLAVSATHALVDQVVGLVIPQMRAGYARRAAVIRSDIGQVDEDLGVEWPPQKPYFLPWKVPEA
jgi:hypothetical protein